VGEVVEDRGQLRLSDEGFADRAYIAESLGLKDLQDAYRLAVAVALEKNLVPTTEDVRRTTVYGATVLDSTGGLRAAILALRGDHDGRPYALMERLAEAGLKDIAGHLREGRPIRQYLQPLVQAPEPPNPVPG